MGVGGKVKRVRAEPGGLVDLEFTADGWTVRQILGSRLDPSIWCVIWMATALGLAGLAHLGELMTLRKVFLVIAGILLAVAVVLVALEFVANLIGVASMTGSALRRRRLRAEAKEIEHDLFELQRRPEHIQAVRVVSGVIRPDVRGIAVELTLDDGTLRRYVRKRDGLVQPFRQLLGDRLTPAH